MSEFNPNSSWQLLQQLFPNGQGESPLDPNAVGTALQVASPMQGMSNAGGDYSMFSPTGIFGGTMADGSRVNGWGQTALGLGQGLMGAFMGMKQYGLAKDALKQSQGEFEKNYAAQRQMTNTQMEDRQRARVAANPQAYQSVGDYMQQHGVK